MIRVDWDHELPVKYFGLPLSDGVHKGYEQALSKHEITVETMILIIKRKMDLAKDDFFPSRWSSINLNQNHSKEMEASQKLIFPERRL